MSPVTTRPQEEDEDYLEEASAEEVKTSQPAVSDRRRRRLQARGIEPVEVPVESNAGQTAAKGRPTPSRDSDVAEQSNNVVTRTVRNLREYIHDVRSELGKVAWPTREETIRLSQIVLAVTIISAAFLGLVSFFFGALTAAVAQVDSSTWAGLLTIAIIIVVAVAWLIRDRIFPSYE